MRELGRILSRRRFLPALILIVLVNGVLFVRQQRKADYGLDLELPRRSVVFSFGPVTLDEEKPDAREAYRRYLDCVERVREMAPEDAAALLEDEKAALSEKIQAETATPGEKLDYTAVNNVLSRLTYLTGYSGWLENIQKNKDDLLTFSIFNDPNSFSGRNIVKTAGEFRLLQGVELKLGADGAVESVLSFPLSDYFLVLALLLTALTFLEERRAGLWSVVHASPGGRLVLGLRRAGILLAMSVLAAGAIYGTDLLLALAIYGGADFGRAAQSVEALGRLPELWTVGGFLGRFFLLRAASGYLVALTLWLMLAAVNNVKYTLIVSGAALAAEYSLYTFLPVQSAFNIFKYFNIFTYISLSALYTNYLNIDIFGFPLGIRAISQGALGPLLMLAAAGCVAAQCLKRPAAGRDLLGRAAQGVNSLTDRLLRRLGFFGMELHKTLWIQKGVVVAAVFVYAALGLEYAAPVPVYTPAERAARDYTRELSGPLTEDTFRRMDAIEADLNATLTARDEARTAYAAGEIGYPELDVLERDAAAAQQAQEGLNDVRDRAQELRELGERQGFTPWLLDESPFESVYGQAARGNQDRAAALALLALALLLSGAMAYERQSGMSPLLRSAPRGRAAFAARKLLLAAAASVLVWGTWSALELWALMSQYAPDCWAAPARSLTGLAALPVPLSIAGALAALYAVRLLALFSCAVMALFVSSLCRRAELAALASAGALLAPSLLSIYVGLEALRPLALVPALELTPLIFPHSGALWAAAGSVAAVLVLGALCAALLLASARSHRAR